jgi:hypothetical protein
VSQDKTGGIRSPIPHEDASGVPRLARLRGCHGGSDAVVARRVAVVARRLALDWAENSLDFGQARLRRWTGGIVPMELFEAAGVFWLAAPAPPRGASLEGIAGRAGEVPARSGRGATPALAREVDDQSTLQARETADATDVQSPPGAPSFPIVTGGPALDAAGRCHFWCLSLRFIHPGCS